jgi:hypothetical protein
MKPIRVHLCSSVVLLLLSACGHDQPPGTIEGKQRPPAAVEHAAARQRHAAEAIAPEAPPPKQILFGDLHVHTTYSIDAFVFALPLFAGEGVHPPADACDFARYCSGLDFFSLNDHAEALTPERWQWTKESLRECNARAGDGANPDLVVFAGWEWTQVGETPENHYGHKNVIFPGLADDELPTRAISALPDRVFASTPRPWLMRGLQLTGAVGLDGYADFFWLLERMSGMPACAKDVESPRLPPDCRENAPTPRELYEKLDQWGLEYLVIPHGLSWGIHAPAGSRLDVSLDRLQYQPRRERLLEIYSGHGNNEEFRAAAGVDKPAVCPPPSGDYLPCCWQAGEIMRARCGDLEPAECERRVEEAKRLALESPVAPHLVFPDAQPEEWLDCDQCRDCFKPTFATRPGQTAQYGLALSDPTEADANGEPLRFRWGFIGSSDNHQGRPGTGYKQYGRAAMTDSRGIQSGFWDSILRPRIYGRADDPRQPQRALRDERSFGALLDVERVSSFMYPGGLVGLHAAGRSREAIWQALLRREVYGTSGPRILLWFDLIGEDGSRRPMGSEVVSNGTPRFEVRAIGSLEQKPGCPPESLQGLSPERLHALCRGECYNPGEERHRIAAIEVVRIRPQLNPGESVERLIEDPWRRFECRDEGRGCSIRFDDPEFSDSGRDAVYYVRALQAETPAINGDNLRIERDARGNVVKTSPCHGNYRSAADDDCLAPVQERAWSSPIFVDRE